MKLTVEVALCTIEAGLDVHSFFPQPIGEMFSLQHNRRQMMLGRVATIPRWRLNWRNVDGQQDLCPLSTTDLTVAGSIPWWEPLEQHR